MIHELTQWTSAALGLDVPAQNLTFLQISLRGLIVFIAALVIVRLANKRFLARRTAFDAILGFILASMLARAVNGSAAFFPTLGGGLVLVVIHRAMAALAFRSHRFSLLVKGSEDVIIEEGRLDERKMRRHNLTQGDLLEDLRLEARIDDPGLVKTGRLERSGAMSFVLKQNRST